MLYGILNKYNEIEYAPLNYGNILNFNTNKELLREYGYKEIIDTPKPLYDESYQTISYKWMEDITNITKEWTIIDYRTKEQAIEEQVKNARTYLIEDFNYKLKEKVAYNGVIFDYQNKELCFETSKESMSLINFILTQIISGRITTVTNWKCREVIEPYEPYNVNFTAEQFVTILTFANIMVNTAFSLESNINEQIKNFTDEQILNEDFINQFKEKTEDLYSQINIKISQQELYKPNIVQEEPQEDVQEQEELE